MKELWLCVGRIVRSKFELIPQTTVVLYLGSGIGHGGAQTFDDVCKTSTLRLQVVSVGDFGWFYYKACSCWSSIQNPGLSGSITCNPPCPSLSHPLSRARSQHQRLECYIIIIYFILYYKYCRGHINSQWSITVLAVQLRHFQVPTYQNGPGVRIQDVRITGRDHPRHPNPTI